MRWAEDAWFVSGKPLVPAMFVVDISKSVSQACCWICWMAPIQCRLKSFSSLFCALTDSRSTSVKESPKKLPLGIPNEGLLNIQQAVPFWLGRSQKSEVRNWKQNSKVVPLHTLCLSTKVSWIHFESSPNCLQFGFLMILCLVRMLLQLWQPLCLRQCGCGWRLTSA